MLPKTAKDTKDSQSRLDFFLMHAPPALEQLQSTWEKKHDNPQYALYKDTLTDGLEKVGKYYSCLDKKPSFVLMLSKTLIPLVVRHINETFEVLHPYYKLAYIKVLWGGPDKQAAEIEAENPDVKD